MNIRFLLAFAVSFTCLGAGAPSAGDGRVITILNWSDYIGETILDDFQRETGLEVVYDTYESGEVAERFVMARGSQYDVVVLSSEYVRGVIASGAVRQIDPARLRNRGNISGEHVDRFSAFDADSAYTSPYLWGTTGIGFDAVKVREIMPDAPTDSWAMIFDPEIVSRFSGCGVSLVDAPQEILASALAYLGYDPNTSDEKELMAAHATISAIRPYVSQIDASQNDDLASGAACLAVGWSGDILGAADEAPEGVEIEYSVPKEGAAVWVDMFMIPVDAPNADLAHIFIDYMLRPDVIARCANELWYAHANGPALELTEPELLRNQAIFPAKETSESLFAIAPRPAETRRAFDRRWFLFKLG